METSGSPLQILDKIRYDMTESIFYIIIKYYCLYVCIIVRTSCDGCQEERERVFVRYNLVIIPNYQYKDYFYIKNNLC